MNETAGTGVARSEESSPWFATTHWSVVLEAARGSGVAGAAALEKLCCAYWYPLYSYIRRRGYEVEEAQDLTQEFFAHLLEKHVLERGDPGRGQFRSFLLCSLKNFLANEWRKSHAEKRGGHRIIISLDDKAEARYASEPSTDEDPEKLFERRWLLSLFELALVRARELYRESGKERLFSCLKEYLSADVQEGDYQRLGRELAMSQGAISTAVCRLRTRYRELVREEIGRTVSDPGQIGDEMRALLRSLD